MAEIDQISQSLRQLADDLGGASKGFDSLGTSISRGFSSSSQEKRLLDEIRLKTKQMNAELAKSKGYFKSTTAAYNNLATSRRKNISDLSKEITVQRANDKAMMDSNKAINRQINGYKQYAKEIHAATGEMKKWTSLIPKTMALMTGTTVTVRGTVSALKEYNKGVFDLSRSQQVSGRGFKGFNDALDKVRKNTVLSDNDFVKYANTVSKLHIGLRPTVKTMGEWADVIEKKMGPGIDQLISSTTILYGIQSKFPSLHAQIKQTSIDMSKAQTDADKKRLAIQATLLKMRVSHGSGFSKEEYAETAKVLSQTTSQQKKQIESTEKMGKAAQSAKNAELEFGKTAEGAIIKAAEATTMLYDVLQKIPAAAITAAAAFQVMGKVASMNMTGAAGSAASMGVGGLGMGTAVAGGGMAAGMAALGVGAKSFAPLALLYAGVTGYSEYGKLKKQNVSTGKAAAAGAAKGGLAGLGTLGGAALGAAIGTAILPGIGTAIGAVVLGTAGAMAGDVAGSNISDLIANKKKGADITEKEEKQLIDNLEVLRKINSDMNYRIAIQKEIIGGIQSQISVAQGLGIVNEEMVDNLRNVSKELRIQSDYVKEQIRDFADLNKAALKQAGFTFNFDKGASDVENMKKLISELNDRATEIGDGNDGFEAAQQLSAKATVLTTQKVKLLAAAVKAQQDESSVVAKTQQDINAIYAERLSLERGVMQTAMFGLGPDIAMIQKQVDLEYEMMEVEQQRARRSEAIIRRDFSKIDSSQLEDIRNARGNAELSNTALSIALKIENVGEKTADVQARLIGYAKEYQKAVSGSLTHTQKIYDLTKQMREGYLDAIREMSFGAGEFSKIIGTQDVGITQLMDSVREMSGAGKLNTMAKGGRGNLADLDESRLKPAGFFRAKGGPSFQDTSNQYKDLYRGRESMRTSFGGRAPTVGSAISPWSGQDVRANQDANQDAMQITADGLKNTSLQNRGTFRDDITIGVSRAIKDRGGSFPGVGPNVGKNSGRLGSDRSLSQSVSANLGIIDKAFGGSGGFGGAGGSAQNFRQHKMADVAQRIKNKNIAGGQALLAIGDGVFDPKKRSGVLAQFSTEKEEAYLKGQMSGNPEGWVKNRQRLQGTRFYERGEFTASMGGPKGRHFSKILSSGPATESESAQAGKISELVNAKKRLRAVAMAVVNAPDQITQALSDISAAQGEIGRLNSVRQGHIDNYFSSRKDQEKLRKRLSPFGWTGWSNVDEKGKLAQSESMEIHSKRGFRRTSSQIKEQEKLLMRARANKMGAETFTGGFAEERVKKEAITLQKSFYTPSTGVAPASPSSAGSGSVGGGAKKSSALTSVKKYPHDPALEEVIKARFNLANISVGDQGYDGALRAKIKAESEYKTGISRDRDEIQLNRDLSGQMAAEKNKNIPVLNPRTGQPFKAFDKKRYDAATVGFYAPEDRSRLKQLQVDQMTSTNPKQTAAINNEIKSIENSITGKALASKDPNISGMAQNFLNRNQIGAMAGRTFGTNLDYQSAGAPRATTDDFAGQMLGMGQGIGSENSAASVTLIVKASEDFLLEVKENNENINVFVQNAGSVLTNM